VPRKALFHAVTNRTRRSFMGAPSRRDALPGHDVGTHGVGARATYPDRMLPQVDPALVGAGPSAIMIVPSGRWPVDRRGTSMTISVASGGGAVMMWQYGNGMGGWGLGLMTAGNVLIWVLVVVGVLALVRHLSRNASATPRATAEELVAERFARSEISEQEYRDGLDVLRR
jgi:putative membrane protein